MRKTEEEVLKIIEKIKQFRKWGWKKKRILIKLNLTSSQYQNYWNWRTPERRALCLKRQADCREKRRQQPFFTLKSRVFHFMERGVCTIPFTYEDVLNKFGENPKCYLTGEKIDYHNGKTYQLDHVHPISKGGLSNLDNLQLINPSINTMKNYFSVEEIRDMARKIYLYTIETNQY